MKYFFLGILIFISVSALGFGLRVLLFPASTASTLVDTAYDIKDKTLKADNVVYNYEWFKQQVEDIKAVKAKVDIADKAVADFESMAGSRKDWTFEDKTEDARLRAISQGLRSQTENIIADYNARSKMANRNIFKDGVIPSVLEWGSSFLK